MPSWRTLCKALSEVNGLNLAFRTLAKAHGGIVILIIITNVTIDSNAKSSLSAELIVDLINYQLGTEQYHRFNWFLYVIVGMVPEVEDNGTVGGAIRGVPATDEARILSKWQHTIIFEHNIYEHGVHVLLPLHIDYLINSNPKSINH